MREIRSHIWFYIGSLNHRATSSLPRQPKYGFQLLLKVLDFWKNHTHQNLWIPQKSYPQDCKNPTYKPGITLGTL